ncbi:MAG TPA: porin family protein [Burkholderiales bacterium]|nr:porin family protein [Burkholderiales bacterium]
MARRVKSGVALAVLAGGLLACQPVIAQERGLYLGGSLGQAKLKEWCSVGPTDVLTACEDTDTAWKLLGGYRFNRYVAIEATYIDWGKATGTVNGVNVSAEQTSMGVAAVGSFEFTPQFSVFGKAGFLMTEQEIQRTTPGSSTRIEGDETEFHYGLGLRFRFAPNWAARAEWEKTEKLEVELLSIGLEYRF